MLSELTNLRLLLAMRFRLQSVYGGPRQLLNSVPALNYERHVISRFLSTESMHGSKTGLPQPSDLLEQYRGLVALGKLKYDPEQVRVIMHVRTRCAVRHPLLS